MKPRRSLLVAALVGAIVIGAGCGTQKATPAPEKRMNQTQQQMKKPGVTRRTPAPAPEMGIKMTNKSETVLRAEVRKVCHRVAGVSKSTVVVMKPTMTALVGVNLKPGKGPAQASKITEMCKTKVEALPGIKMAYVTADPDLVSRVKALAKDIAAGKPLSGLKTETEQIISRIGPK